MVNLEGVNYGEEEGWAPFHAGATCKVRANWVGVCKFWRQKKRVVLRWRDMRMHSQEVPDALIPNENGEVENNDAEEVSRSQCHSSKQKYKELKSRLKYLLYVRPPHS